MCCSTTTSSRFMCKVSANASDIENMTPGHPISGHVTLACKKVMEKFIPVAAKEAVQDADGDGDDRG